jgi:proteic killer suppression protein
MARRLPKALWPIIRRKLDALHRARKLTDLRLPAGNRLEGLKGDRAGTFSLRVNNQYRITFRFEDGYADDVTCVDYH